MLSRMHKTSSKSTWWVDQSGTWRHFGPCTLQSSASGNGNSSVTSEECILEIRERYQWWCLTLQVSFMLPDAEECTNTHHARSKNSTSLLLQFAADHWSAQAVSTLGTLGLGRFPTMDQIKSVDASRKCRFPSDSLRHHASIFTGKTSSAFMCTSIWNEYIIINCIVPVW